MRKRSIPVTGFLVVVIATATLPPEKVFGQTRGTGTKPYEPPRMPDGRPDLQGVYDLATLTPLERPAGANASLTGEQVARLERAVATQVALGSRPIGGGRAD